MKENIEIPTNGPTVPFSPDSESLAEFPGEEDSVRIEPSSGRQQSQLRESEVDRSASGVQPWPEDGPVGTIVTAVISADKFDLLLTDPCENTTDVVANSDFHTFVIKNKAVSSYLDHYSQAVTDRWVEDRPGRGSNKDHGSDGMDLLQPLLEQLSKRGRRAKILFTAKKSVPVNLSSKARQHTADLCNRLKLSAPDRSLIAEAMEVHILAKLRRPDQGPGTGKSVIEANARLLRALSERPLLVRMLRSMYCSLEGRDTTRSSIDLVGASVLTIVDLFCDSLGRTEHVTAERYETVVRELGALSGKLFLPTVAKAFLRILADETPSDATLKKANRVAIFSDHAEGIYPLEARLRNEGFDITTTASMESFVAICRNRRPDAIIVRINASPRIVFSTLHTLTRKGVNVRRIPALLMAKNTLALRQASLLQMGVHDIIDLDDNLDVLVFKIKKVQAQLRESTKSSDEALPRQSGSKGNLSDMNLIDLLQALGPSLRTTRIQVGPEDATIEPLVMYLARGKIIFAQCGNLLGETAIYEALGWVDGAWTIKPVAEKDLPEPNSHQSNESILMEGCRLLDEKARKAGVS